MIITYHGAEFFKITLGQLTIACNPIAKSSKLKGARFGADIALVSLNDEDTNGVDAVTLGDKEPFVISGPGEYERNELFIKGFLSKSSYKGKDRFNTIYTMKLDDINICYLGALSDTDLSVEAKEAFDEVDILFVPIGGQGVLDAAEAYKFAVKREPKIIIPMHYGEVGDAAALKTFLKEGGNEGLKPIEKLTIKRKDLPTNTQIVVLEQ